MAGQWEAQNLTLTLFSLYIFSYFHGVLSSEWVGKGHREQRATSDPSPNHCRTTHTHIQNKINAYNMSLLVDKLLGLKNNNHDKQFARKCKLCISHTQTYFKIFIFVLLLVEG